MDLVLQGDVASSVDSKIEEAQKIEDKICERRGVLRSLREENVSLRQNYIERLRQTQDLKREKEALEGTAHDLSTRASLLKDELQARNTTNESLDLQVCPIGILSGIVMFLFIGYKKLYFLERPLASN